MHECPYCGQACDCDGDDTWLNPPGDCSCPCEEDGEDEWAWWLDDDSDADLFDLIEGP